MPQTRQPYTFDPNAFLLSVLPRPVFASAIDRTISVLTDPKWRSVSEDGIYVVGYNGPTTDEKLQEQVTKSPTEAAYKEAEYELFKNPNSPASAEILSFWKVVGPVLSEDRPFYKQDFLILLNRIGFLGLTPEMQLELLKDVYKNKLRRGNEYFTTEQSNQDRKEIVHALYMKILSNPKATLKDKADAAAQLRNIDITRDVIAEAKNELDKEMHKTTDFQRDAVEEISNAAIKAASGLSSEYEKEVKDFFDLDNIYKIGSEYVAKTEESDREKRIKAENELRTEKINYSNAVANKDNEINRLNQDLRFANEDLDKQKVKNDKLTRQLNEMEAALRDMQTIVKTIKLKAAAVATEGMFGRGKKIEELNAFIKEAMSKSKVMIQD